MSVLLHLVVFAQAVADEVTHRPGKGGDSDCAAALRGVVQGHGHGVSLRVEKVQRGA